MKKLLLISCLFVLNNSFAANIHFGGSIGTSCTISNVTNGQLIQTGPRKLDANTQGIPASLTVTNNAAGQYKVTISQPSGWSFAPQNVSNTGFQITPRVVGPNANSGFSPNGGKFETELNVSGSDLFQIGLQFEEFTLSALPQGEYSVVVTVLCEPK